MHNIIIPPVAIADAWLIGLVAGGCVVLIIGAIAVGLLARCEEQESKRKRLE